MAQLRLIAMLALASCGRGEAAPSQLQAPAGWRSAPELAKAASDAAGSAATATEGWAEPARGCYAVWLALHGAAASIDAAADQLLAGVQKLGVTASEIVKPQPAEHGELAFAFSNQRYRGRMRALLAKTGDVSALACMWNEREPKACEAQCVQMLGGLR
ncbi:MAG TPA: hypothetical protein VGG28_03080 [Kofleriaceae bacterium]|jgi:hypothetical protein